MNSTVFVEMLVFFFTKEVHPSQYYRSGNDYISEHADKTIDVERGSMIVNLSLGASRVMVLRSKNKGESEDQKITLPHNSVFVLGWDTNREWRHSVKQDKRLQMQKREDELTSDGQRISLTFRLISTFMRQVDGRLFGQGARTKRLSDLPPPPQQRQQQQQLQQQAQAEDTVEEANRMLLAFSAENKDPSFDWDQVSGASITDAKAPRSTAQQATP